MSFWCTFLDTSNHIALKYMYPNYSYVGTGHVYLINNFKVTSRLDMYPNYVSSSCNTHEEGAITNTRPKSNTYAHLLIPYLEKAHANFWNKWGSYGRIQGWCYVKVRLDLDKCWNIARTQSFYYECWFWHREVWTKDGGGLDQKTRVVLDLC